MRCINCQQDINNGARVCPFCRRNPYITDTGLEPTIPPSGEPSPGICGVLFLLAGIFLAQMPKIDQHEYLPLSIAACIFLSIGAWCMRSCFESNKVGGIVFLGLGIYLATRGIYWWGAIPFCILGLLYLTNEYK